MNRDEGCILKFEFKEISRLSLFHRQRDQQGLRLPYLLFQSSHRIRSYFRGAEHVDYSLKLLTSRFKFCPRDMLLEELDILGGNSSFKRGRLIQNLSKEGLVSWDLSRS